MLNDDFLNLFIDPLTWDKNSYKFNREEKDMRPYSVTNTKKDTIIVHNVLGIDKKDLNLQEIIQLYKLDMDKSQFLWYNIYKC